MDSVISVHLPNNENIFSFPDKTNPPDYEWISLFKNNFNNLNTSMVYQIVHMFYELHVKRITSEWLYQKKDGYIIFEHYSNKHEKKYMIHIHGKEINFYLIGQSDKYVAYSNNNGVVGVITDTTVSEVFIPRIHIKPEPNTITNKWYIDDKIIYEYYQIVVTPFDNLIGSCVHGRGNIKGTQAFFYIIHHTDKQILEIYNGCHWIFKCDKYLKVSNDFLVSLINPLATSVKTYEYNSDIITPLFADRHALLYHPGEILCVAYGSNIYFNIDDELINLNYMNLFDDSSICDSKNYKLIQKLGYNLFAYKIQNYDYISIYDCMNDYPSIKYKQSNNSLTILSDHLTISYKTNLHLNSLLSQSETYSASTLYQYKKYSIIMYTMLDNSNRLTVKYYNDCVLFAKVVKINDHEFKFIISYFNNSAYDKLIRNVDDCLEKRLVSRILMDKSIFVKYFTYKDLLRRVLYETTDAHSDKVGSFYLNPNDNSLETNKVSMNYNYKYKQFNLHIKYYDIDDLFALEPEDGGGFSSESKDDTVTFHTGNPSETNTIINLDTRNVIMSDNQNGSLVDIDMYTQEIKPIRVGYKYGITSNDEDNKSEKVVIELELFEDSKIVSAPDKSRTNKCRVIKIYDPTTGDDYEKAYGLFIRSFQYNKDELITIRNFKISSNVCCSGIHFCNSLYELRKWSY